MVTITMGAGVPHGSSQGSACVTTELTSLAPVVGAVSILDGSTATIINSKRADEIKLAANVKMDVSACATS